jgi:hypothetical protein
MLELVVSISSILGSLSLVVGVILVLREMRATTRVTRANNAQTLVGIAGPFYTSLIQDRGVADLFLRGSRDYPSLDEIDQYRYRNLMIWWLIFHENVFYQRRLGLLDGRAFEAWSQDLGTFLREHKLSQHWGELEHLFQRAFAEKVRQLLAEQDPPQAA